MKLYRFHIEITLGHPAITLKYIKIYYYRYDFCTLNLIISFVLIPPSSITASHLENFFFFFFNFPFIKGINKNTSSKNCYENISCLVLLLFSLNVSLKQLEIEILINNFKSISEQII